MYRNLLIIGAGCLLCLVLFFLTFTGDSRERADFVWNNETEPQTLDPVRMSGQPGGAIAFSIFEGLTTYHPETLEPTPGVAKSWEIDGLTYTFHLRDDAWWVKGSKIYESASGKRRVTAHDFVHTWRMHAYPETGSGYAYLFEIIEGYAEYKAAVEKDWKEISRLHEGVAKPADVEDKADRIGILRRRVELWEELVKMRAIDDLTLEVTLRAAAPYITTLTSFYAFFPVPIDVVEEHGAKWVQPENIVTNGPYYLEKWRFNAFIRLRKNRHYWETPEHVETRLAELGVSSPQPLPANLERERDLLNRLGSFVDRGFNVIEALAVEEENTSLNLYINGDVDRIRELPINIVGEVVDASLRPGGLRHVHHAPQLAVYFYLLNLDLPAFQGETGWKLRKAMALCLDREGLIETVTREKQVPAYSMVPPGVPDFPRRGLLGSGSFKEDLEEARRLIAEVMKERGSLPRLKILYNTSENHSKIAAFIQDGWRRHLGLKCDLTNQEWGVFLVSRETGRYILARMGWIGDYLDANTFLDLYTTGNPNNDCRYSNPFYDRLLLRYAAHVEEFLRSPDQRAAMLADLRAQPLYAQRKQGDGETAETREDALAKAIVLYDTSNGQAKLAAAFRMRGILLEFAEEVLLYDVPIIPVFFYTRAQLWPPELEGMQSNLVDSHPPKFFRWKDGKRPTQSRYGDFPRLD